MSCSAEVFDSIAYGYDGSLEGLLTAVFDAYANREDPNDVSRTENVQLRLGQYLRRIDTDADKALRVKNGIVEKCGYESFSVIRKASTSSDPFAGTAAYRFIRYAMDAQKTRDCKHCRKRSLCTGAVPKSKAPCPRQHGRALSDITHPYVEPLVRIARSVDNECERMRQFVRFQHVRNDDTDFWIARCNPRDAVVPLVMNHFVERFNVQPFVIYDEAHGMAGVYEGKDWYLVQIENDSAFSRLIPPATAEETIMQDAWRRFYRSVSIDARYNPELRRQFMPKRLWRNLTEMQEDLSALPMRSRD